MLRAMPGLVERVQQMQRDNVMAQGGVTIPDVLDASEMAFMQQVFPQVRVAARFSDPNWSAHGYPDGPQLSPASYAAVSYVWPQVRVAANWSDPNWSAHPIPYSVIAAALPPPEAEAPPPAATAAPAPPAAVTTPAATPVTNTQPVWNVSAPAAPALSPGSLWDQGPLYSQDPIEEGGPATAPVQQASLFGKFSTPLLIGLTIAGFFLFRGKSPLTPRRRRR